MINDPVSVQMDLIARVLEGLGYGVEVLYAEAKLIVWLAEWPVLVELQRQPRVIQPQPQSEEE